MNNQDSFDKRQFMGPPRMSMPPNRVTSHYYKPKEDSDDIDVKEETLPYIDKFNQTVIDDVCKEVETEVNTMNQNGFTAAVPEDEADGYDMYEGAERQSDGNLIGDEKKVKNAMNEFKNLWMKNLQKHCLRAKQNAKLRRK